MLLPLTPVRFLYRALDLFAGRTAVVSERRRFSFAELGERCERLASALRHAGIQPGDRIAYLSLNTHQLLEGYYGVPMASGVAMPLNVRLSPMELAGILEHSGARVLFFEADFQPLIELFRRQCPGIERFVQLGDEYETFLSDASPEASDYSKIDENSVAELFYTSGSTGTPRGVLLTHRALYMHAMAVSTVYLEADTMVDLQTIPLFHANGWGHAHTDVLLGVPQIMVRRFDPPAVLELIQRYRATDMSLVPTMAVALLNVPQIADFDLSSMRDIQLGGAASSPELIGRLETAFRCRAWSGYGLTETAPVICISRPDSNRVFASDEERYALQAKAGRPIAGVDLRVVDDHGNVLPRNSEVSGEVIVRCDHLMAGYYRDPEATASVMKDGWLYTGDMAIQDAEGYVQIVDRRKEIIISGGENISSIEVERAIAAHPCVLECAVVGAPDENWGEVPAAIVVCRAGSTVTADELLTFLDGRLGRFKIPRIVDFEPGPLPKTGTGKIRKLLLRERYRTGAKADA